jgi:hypothetical protein
MNLSVNDMVSARGSRGSVRGLNLALFLLLVTIATACSDSVTPAPVPIATQTALQTQNEIERARYTDATAQAAGPTPTYPPIAVTNACDVLTKEEVNSAIPKPMEPTMMASGRCIYQGDAEYLLLTLYTGLTEEAAKKMFNWYWADPSFPVTTSRTFELHIYRRAEEPNKGTRSSP